MNERVDESPLSDSRDDFSAAASELRMATFRLARRLRAQRAIDTMSDGQFAVLAALDEDERRTLAAAAEIMRKVADT